MAELSASATDVIMTYIQDIKPLRYQYTYIFESNI